MLVLEDEFEADESMVESNQNLDTIMDCPEEEDYESQTRGAKVFMNCSYSKSRCNT